MDDTPVMRVSVASETSTVTYTGNNSNSTPYPVTFGYLDDSANLTVFKTLTSSGAVTTMTETTDYTVGASGVTTVVAVPSTYTLTIQRDTPRTQPTEYTEGGKFPADSHETALDRIVHMVQESDRDGAVSAAAAATSAAAAETSAASAATSAASAATSASTAATDAADAATAAAAEDAANAAASAAAAATSETNAGTSETNAAASATAAATSEANAAASAAAAEGPVYRPDTLGYGFADADATAAISAAGVTDDQAESHYHQIIGLIKSLRCWDDLSNGYLLGDKWQDSSTTPKSLTGANNGSGTSTYGNWSATFNGTTDKYLFANGDASTSSTGRCFICVYKHNGVKQPAMLVSNYAGGTTKGMSLSVAGSSLGSTGGGLLDDAFLYASADGSANTIDMTLTGTVDTDWSVAVANHRDGWIELWNNRTNPTRAALANQWINNANHSIGSTPNGAYFFAGEIAFAAEFTAGLEAWQVAGLIRGIERILGDVLPLTNEVIFEGNSLTASAPGGGTTYPAQLMAEAGWSDLRWVNQAADGAKQITNIEGQFDWQISRYAPRADGQDNLLIFWSGINDITAGTTATAIIASLERYLVRAKAAGFRVALLTLTPVADTGDGLTYGYNATQQGYLTAVNTWIRSTSLADTVVDLDEIGDTYPEFLDPTDTTYYISGDGLHHNNAGRGLIAAKVAAEVTAPA